jgi:hypothetical protein
MATMSEKILVQISASDCGVKQCEIELSEGSLCKIEFFGIDLNVSEFVGEDFFEALIELRLELEKHGYQLLCRGARPNVHPSGLSRSMSRGRKAYIIRVESPSLKTDIVNIFDRAELEEVGSVEEQRAFHKRWVESWRNK